jgi:hypothetical protein
VQARSVSTRFTGYSFDSIRIDGVTCDHDLIIDRGKIRNCKKAASRKFRRGGHPVAMPPTGNRHRLRWRAARDAAGPRRGPPPQIDLVILPAADVILPTADATGALTKAPADTNAILHLTC